MSRSAVSMLAFGIYLWLLGPVLIVAPNALLGVFGIAPTREVWIRVIGFLVGALGYYYVRGARADVRPLFRWSVHARATMPLFLGAFVALRLVEPALLVFAAVDVAFAGWTAAALRLDERSPR